ncbi:MAG TPA: hypothetical protein VEW74_00860 [Candidatus Nitrosotalea sp.]|nr:hypothetical protein [Candidatus Nitrosotalea sp.]
MNDAITRELAAAADSESPREERARKAAELVRASRAYRWVGIYDVGDDDVALLAQSGVSAREASVGTRTTIAGIARTVVPVLGAESGIAIGTLEAESGEANAFEEPEIAFLEDCAALLRPLYD